MKTTTATTVFKMPLYGSCFPLSACPASFAVFRTPEKLSCANEVSTSSYLDNRCSLISKQNVPDLISLLLQYSAHADLLSFYTAKSAPGLSRHFFVNVTLFLQQPSDKMR